MTEAPYGEGFQRALGYAARAHAGQFRKGSSIPYVAHLLAVCSLVLEGGGDEDQAIAALLHDAPEDLEGERTLADIDQQFGAHVATLVAALSDTLEHPKPPWRERKERYLMTLNEEPAEVLLISLADKVHNAHAILADYQELGDALWLRFNTKSGPDQLWYYGSLAAIFTRRMPGRLADELTRTVEALKALMAPDG
jgi:(p)ppGpp synthase/HD superfamily hydrolase